MKKKKLELKRYIFLHMYANIPSCLRDKSCGLSWDEVYKLLNENGEK